MRDTEPTNDRCRSNRIWRGDNCSEGKSSRPWKPRHSRVRDPRDREHCRKHESNREQEYRPQISPEITPGCKQRSRIDECRKNEVKEKIGIQIQHRRSRHETQSESAENKHDWV